MVVLVVLLNAGKECKGPVRLDSTVAWLRLLLLMQAPDEIEVGYGAMQQHKLWDTQNKSTY